VPDTATRIIGDIINMHSTFSPKGLTPLRRVEIALRGGHADRVPFTMYEGHLLQTAAERHMRNRGLCIVNRQSVYAIRHPNVKTTRQEYWQDGKKFVRTVHETPVGNLSWMHEDAGFTYWVHEKMFKTPEDYKAMLFFVRDECCWPTYQAVAAAQPHAGEDVIFRASFGSEPLQILISGTMMDMQDFCIQWMENRDEILTLYEAIAENRRKVYPIVAASPLMHANYGGNVTPEIIGLETFEKYYVQHYNEAAEIMHKHGKLIGCHFDANCRLLARAIAATDLDYIEAFTPAPDTDMTLAEARQAWPDKVLWLNFPSSVHLRPDREVQAATVALLDEAGTPDGLIMGITEDIPPGRWQDSCLAIMDGLDSHEQLHPQLYA
jgi:hypothetical protein